MCKVSIIKSQIKIFLNYYMNFSDRLNVSLQFFLKLSNSFILTISKSPWKSDDLVSCYFCFINMLDPDLLNWRRLRDNKEILKRKKEYSAKKAHTNFPPVAQHFFDEYYNHIISLDYGCEPDYSGIKAMTKNLLKVWNITSGMPYEWEDVDDTPKKPKEVVKEKPNIVKIKEDENNAASWVNRLFINRFLCNRAVVN